MCSPHMWKKPTCANAKQETYICNRNIVSHVKFEEITKEPNSGKSVFPIPISPFPVKGSRLWQLNAHSKHTSAALFGNLPPLFFPYSVSCQHPLLTNSCIPYELVSEHSVSNTTETEPPAPRGIQAKKLHASVQWLSFEAFDFPQ